MESDNDIYAMIYDFLTVGYLLNGLKVLDITVTLSNSVLCLKVLHYQWIAFRYQLGITLSV